LEAFYGAPVEAQFIARTWTPHLVQQMVSAVWAGYNDLQEEILSHIDWEQRFENLERGLTEQLERCIGRRLDANLVVYIGHSQGEEETRASAKAQPPTYDLAFILHADMRLRWPLEAKVLQSDANTITNLGDYIKTFQERLMSCQYAPFSSSGAMLGYLKSGDANTALDRLALRLPAIMTAHPAFPTRAHRTSDHTREVAPEKPYPAQFQCHHMMMPLSQQNNSVVDQQ
jgi:hypothetical protein